MTIITIKCAPQPLQMLANQGHQIQCTTGAGKSLNQAFLFTESASK